MNAFVKKLVLLSPLAALLIVLVAAGPAAAEPVIPPANSAANQYTESFPTGGGDRNAYAEGDEISPGKVLGKRNAEKLDAQGEEGRAAAELAAETAPAPALAPEASEDEEESSGGGGGKPANNGGGGGDRGGQPDSAGSPPTQSRNPTPESTGTLVAADTSIEGSSGIGEVLSQVFGTSSAGMGLLLPLLLIAVAIWAFGFAARHRQRPAD